MDNKLIVGALLVALVLGGFVGYAIAPAAPQGVSLGGTNASSSVLSFYAALNSQDLWDAQNSQQMDINNLREPLAGLAVGSASVSWGTLGGATDSSSTVINIALGGTIGDLVLVSPAASGTITFGGQITATGVTNASATVYAVNATSTSAIAGTLTTRVWVLPVASFVVPDAILTTTSTSF